MQNLLIVDDDEIYCEVLKDAFKKRGFHVETAIDLEQARLSINNVVPDFAVVDLRLQNDSGLVLIKDLKQVNEKIQIVMLTGYASIATAVESIKLGATQYINKPANADEILAAFTHEVPNENIEVQEQPPSVKRLEWEHMQKVLLECDGNISEAARRLNMHRRTLQRKLAKRPVRQ